MAQSLIKSRWSKTVKTLLFSQTALDSLIVLAGSATSSILGFVFVFIIARKLGPSQFGIYSTVINYATFLAAVVDIGINQSLVRFVNSAKSDTEQKKWVSTSLLAVTTTTLLLGLLATLFYHFFLRHIWNHQEEFSLLIFITVFIITINTFLLSFFQTFRRFWSRSLFDITFSVVRLLIIGGALIFGTINLNWSFDSIIFAYVFASVIGFFVIRKQIDFSLIDSSKIWEIFKFSRWLALVNFFANLYGRLDVMMLAWLSTAYTTGIYAAAARFIMIFPLVVSSLSSVISPRFAGFTQTHETHAYFKKTIGISLLVTVVMSILIIIAKPLILAAYSREFQQAVPVFQLLVLANIPLILSIPATNAIIYFFKKPQYITFTTFIQLLGLFTLTRLLVPSQQMFGPVYSLLAMNSFGLITYYLVYMRLANKNISL